MGLTGFEFLLAASILPKLFVYKLFRALINIFLLNVTFLNILNGFLNVGFVIVIKLNGLL